MAFLFNDDKTKLTLSDAIKTASYSKLVQIQPRQPASAIFALSSDELYSKGYIPLAVVGWNVDDPSVGVTGVTMSGLVEGRISVFNPESDWGVVVEAKIYVLWVKQ